MTKKKSTQACVKLWDPTSSKHQKGKFLHLILKDVIQKHIILEYLPFQLNRQGKTIRDVTQMGLSFWAWKSEELFLVPLIILAVSPTPTPQGSDNVPYRQTFRSSF